MSSSFFFCCERLSASMARSLHLSFICIPQSTRALDQGGVEPRQAVSPKALRPWTTPLRYSVGSEQCVFIHLTDGNLMIQLPGCVNEGSIQYPPPSKRKLETLFTIDSCSNFCHAWTVLLFLSMGHCILAD